MEVNGKGGLAIKNWGDVVAIATVLAMLLGTVAWGLKLEEELNHLRDESSHRLSALEARVADGILPRAEERIANHERRINKLEDDE